LIGSILIGLFTPTEFLFEEAHLPHEIVGPFRFRFVHFADGESDVHHDVIAGDRVRHVVQVGFARDPAELDPADPDAADFLGVENLTGYC